jgi:hypothetical protein
MDSAKESRTKKEGNHKSKLFFHIEDHIGGDNDNESIRGKKGISGWTSFVTILIIVHAIFFGWSLFTEVAVNGVPNHIGGLYVLVVLSLPFPMVLIDFIAVLFYVIKKKPREGIGLFLSIIALLFYGMLLVFWLRLLTWRGF